MRWIDKCVLVLFLLICFISPCPYLQVSGICEQGSYDKTKVRKLYWFIPDGMRADPYLFNIYEWAKEGKLPNIKKMMERGTYGYCKPVYPGHTPVNFASLFTGAYPQIHGISDGPMYAAGYPLDKPAVLGFSSTAKTVEPIWVTLEKQGKTVALLSIPGSTPPELKNGYTLVGRWGNWGADFYAINFEELGNGDRKRQQSRQSRLFYFGPLLTIFEKAKPCEQSHLLLKSFSLTKEVSLKAWDTEVFAYIYDSTDDKKINYDRIAFTIDKKKILADLKSGEWSEWLPIQLSWKNVNIDTVFKIKLIKLSSDGFYRVRFLYNAINWTLTEPSYVANDIIENIGPMVDSVDSFPPQLVFYNEDKNTFIEEAEMSFDWHTKAVSYFLKKYKPDVFIHDIYTPNQMLTSRWWLGYIDPDSTRYAEKTVEEREGLWLEVKHMYKRLDDIIGEYLAVADENTVIVLTADHGAVPLDKFVHLNNLFARKGWLKFETNRISGKHNIDWRKSKVIHLNFGNIFINPEGLHDKEGKWYRASGLAYSKLREEVIAALLSLKSKDGLRPVEKIVKWEDAEKVLRLPQERVGDLIVANRPGFGWSEEISDDLKLFSIPLETGYKQAVISKNCPAMWFPFIIIGPGVKKNFFLGNKPINIIDQYPTLMKLLELESPNFVQGKVLKIFNGELKRKNFRN